MRGLEIHGESVERAGAGSRVAVNLAGLLLSQVERGDVIVREGTLLPGSLVDAEMTLLPSARPVDDGARVRVHAGSAEMLARVRVLGDGQIAPGGSGLVQLRLESPAVTVPGDRLVIRSYSPLDTIGGARVLDPHPPRRRRRDGPLVQRLARADGPEDVVLCDGRRGGGAGDRRGHARGAARGSPSRRPASR